MSFTLTTLKQSIQDWTENDETTFVGELDFFITNAEERILKSVDLDYFRKNVTGTMTSGNKFLQKPSDYLATFSLSFVNASTENVFLLQKDVNFIQEYTANPATTGEPIYYAQFDDDYFIVGPAPDSGYTVELHYFYRPQSITASSDGTSWLGTNAPDVLLYGCLIEAYTFMKGEPDVITLYDKRYKEALQQLIIEGDGRNRKDAYRSGQVRIQGV